MGEGDKKDQAGGVYDAEPQNAVPDKDAPSTKQSQEAGPEKSGFDPARAEADAGSSTPDSRGAAEEKNKLDDTLGRGFKPTAQEKGWARRINGFMFGGKNKRRMLIGGGVAGFAVGGTMSMMSLLSGPLEIIHVGQLLERFHFSSHQNASDDRLGKMIRYLRDPRSPQNTRLSTLGNKVADKFEARLNKSGGLKSNYTRFFGLGDGYIVLNGSEKFATKSTPEVLRELQQQYDLPESAFEVRVNSSTNELDIHINTANLSASEWRKVSRGMLQQAGYRKVTSAIGARVLGERAGVTWHPIRKLDNKILRTVDQRFTEWLKMRAQQAGGGSAVDPASIGRAEDTAEQQGTADANNADAAQQAAQDTANDAVETKKAIAEGDPGAMSKFTSSVGGKIAIGGTSAIGLLCLVKTIADEADVKRVEKTIKVAIRLGMLGITSGNQQESGIDTDVEQAGFIKSQYYGIDDNGNKTSWYDAQSIQAELGHPERGVPADETTKNMAKGTPLDFLTQESVYKNALDAACGPVGTVVMTAFSLATGPVGTLLGTAGGLAFGPPIISAIAGWVSGQPINPFAKGATLGHTMNYGVFYAANQQGVSSAGNALSSAEAYQLKERDTQIAQADFAQESVSRRLFDAYDSRSLAGRIIDSGALRSTQNFATTFANAINIPKIFASVASSGGFGIMGRAAATSTYDYGTPKVGFSIADLDDSRFENPLDNSTQASAVLDTNQDYVNRAKECFGVSISKDTENHWVVDGGSDYIDTTSSTYNQGTCADRSLDWLRVRFFIFDSLAMEAASCLENIDTVSCERVGMSPSNNNVPSPATGGGGTVGPDEGPYKHPAPEKRGYGYRFNSYSPYGMTYGGTKIHGGTDMGGRIPIYAACSGVVKIIKKDQSYLRGEWTYSHAVVISCDGGRYETGYHHTMAIDTLSVGMRVTAGDRIGTSDNSGKVISKGGDGSHLHFTVKDLTQQGNGLYGFIDPEPFMKQRGVVL